MIIRPYGNTFNYQNTVDMIRHDHKGIQNDKRIMTRDFVPMFLCDVSDVIQSHHPIPNVSKQMFPIVRANGDKIRAVVRVVISRQSNGSAVAFVIGFRRAIFHAGRVSRSGLCVNFSPPLTSSSSSSSFFMLYFF